MRPNSIHTYFYIFLIYFSFLILLIGYQKFRKTIYFNSLILKINILNESFSSEKVAYITAILGPFESTVKQFANQTVPIDKYCFTTNGNITNNGNWTIDTAEYYYLYPSPLDTGNYTNSLSNNNHTFNRAKYYKQQFFHIPFLQKYRYVVWLDGTIEVRNPDMTAIILDIFKKYPEFGIITWEKTERKGILKEEMIASHVRRYMSTRWGNQNQPYQDVDAQYKYYIENGYNESFWVKNLPYRPFSNDYGVWFTCMIAFDMKKPSTKEFLNFWYLQTLNFTTQDQISFSYVVQKLKIFPYTFPDYHIKYWRGSRTTFFKKHRHHK